MIARDEGGVTYQQQFDADASGRLVAVTNTQTLSATHFVYPVQSALDCAMGMDAAS